MQTLVDYIFDAWLESESDIGYTCLWITI